MSFLSKIKPSFKGSSDNSIKPLWRDWLTYDLITGVILQFIVLFTSMVVWSIKFPKLTFEHSTIINVLYLVLFLPLFTGVFGLWSRTTELPGWASFFTRISLPVFVISIIAAIVLCINPPYCSATNSTKNYMIMDNDLNSRVYDSCRFIFPDSIPVDAGNINYSYYKYKDISKYNFHLSLGETLPEESFSLETDRLTSMTELIASDSSSSDNIIMLDWKTEDDLIVHITIDKAYRRIIYSASYVEVR